MAFTPAGQRQVRLAPLQPRRRLVDRHQGRRARRVQRDRRTLEPQRERHPADCGREAGAGGSVDAWVRATDQTLVVAGRDAAVHSGSTALQPVRSHPRVLQRLPARLEHEPLLRVQQLRLPRRDPEELGVEPIHLLHVRPPRRRLVRLRIHDQAAGTPSRHRVSIRFQQAPERRQVRAARKPARHPHDGDRLPEPRNLLPGGLQLGKEPPREVERPAGLSHPRSSRASTRPPARRWLPRGSPPPASAGRVRTPGGWRDRAIVLPRRARGRYSRASRPGAARAG